MESDMKIKELQDEIKSCKDKYESLLSDIEQLESEKISSEGLCEDIQANVTKQKEKIMEIEKDLDRKEWEHKESVQSMQEEIESLETQAQQMKEQICYFEGQAKNLKKICSSGMVKKMVFKGNLSNNISSFSVKHQIKYPVNGGVALITFQKPSVAAQIIAAKDHTVKMDEECFVHVKSEAVELSVLDALHMEMSLSPSKILVYNLPSGMDEESIMDKLELFFVKSKNGGGEIEKREYLDDCKSAILTFMDKKVPVKLLEKKCFHVPFKDSSHTVSVAPSLEGNLQDYKMRKLVCNRTVIITGIPDIIDKDTMRDLLEIHFQKPSNGGGEVQELMYYPDGQHTVALFKDDDDDEQNDA